MAEKYPSHPSHYVPALTGVRALAALLVLGLHADQNVPAGATVFLPFLARGYLGVDFFFVLSGFIITHVYLISLATPAASAVRIFLWHRFIRLYPVHVMVLLALVLLIWLARANHIPLNNPDEWRETSIPWHLALLHAWGVVARPDWNAPSWSISAEWFAYLLFPLMAPALMFVRDRLAAISIAMAALAVTAATFSLADWTLNIWVGAPALVRVFGEFLCGAALCRTVVLKNVPVFLSRAASPSPRSSLKPGLQPNGDVLGTAAFLLFLIGASAGVPDFALVALLALTVLGAALAGTFLARFLGSAPLVWLGEISYSIYMVHFPILLVTRRFWEWAGIAHWSASMRAVSYALTIGGVIATAAMVFYAIERPARMRLRDRMGRLAPPNVNPA
jgi:peptidoglycan/LPS O-acetylase OafA/YrhL